MTNAIAKTTSLEVCMVIFAIHGENLSENEANKGERTKTWTDMNSS